MHKFKKIIILGAVILFCLGQFGGTADALNLLPGAEFTASYTEKECMDLIKSYEYSTTGESMEDYLKTNTGEALEDYEDLFLGCAIKSGYVRFWMLPYFIKYILNFVVSIAGLIVVLMIILGGYFYIAGAFTDDKEKGKTIIKYALYGFVLILSSWSLVNILLLFLTS